MDFLTLFTLPSFWFDMICIVILVFSCARYVKLGFLAAMIQVFGTLIGLAVSHVVASMADSVIYSLLFEDMLAAKLETFFETQQTNGMEQLADVLNEFLPESVLALLQEDWLTWTEFDLSSNADGIIATLMDTAIAPMVTQAIYMVLFLLVFFLCRALVALLVEMLRTANKLPVLGGVNRFLGWVFGIIGGCVDVILSVCVLWVVMLATDNMLPILNMNDLSTSYVLMLFQTYNPLF